MDVRKTETLTALNMSANKGGRKALLLKFLTTSKAPTEKLIRFKLRKCDFNEFKIQKRLAGI